MVNKTLRLTLISSVAALLLALVNYFTEPLIFALGQSEVETALSDLIVEGRPGKKEASEDPNVVNRWPIDPGKGWILELVAKGYGGPMTLMASFSPEGEVIAAKLLDNNETVGFGKNAEEDGYMDIFKGKGSQIPIPRTKNELGNQVDIVSGATITFSGIAQSLAHGSALVKQWEAK